MYRCKECNAEYEIKPEYCDCGNDTFEEIKTEDTSAKNSNDDKTSEAKEEKEEKTDNRDTQTETVVVERNISEEKNNTSPVIQTYAVVTFAICILLSLLIIFFIGNPKPDNTKNNAVSSETKEQVIEQDKIDYPSIDKIWNDSTEGISEYQEDSNETLNEDSQIVKKKDKAENAENVESSQPVKNVKSNGYDTVSKKTSAPSNKISQTKNQNTTKIQTKSASQKVQPKNNVKKANPQELAEYKVKLRNHIATKIAFASVVGDGSCTFSFKVAADGTLTGKKYVKLSENDTLNEAVYNALKQVYNYRTPPAGYKGETMYLTVKMNNNNFEVYLN